MEVASQVDISTAMAAKIDTQAGLMTDKNSGVFSLRLVVVYAVYLFSACYVGRNAKRWMTTIRMAIELRSRRRFKDLKHRHQINKRYSNSKRICL